MLVYYLNLFFVCLCALFHRNQSRRDLREGFLIGIISFCLIFVAGVRSGVGTDWWNYNAIFGKFMQIPITEIIGQKEWGFWGISSLVGTVTNDVTLVFVIHAALIVIPIILVLHHYSTSLCFSLFLYITMMEYYGSFNGMRQCTAAAFLYLGIYWIYKRKFIPYACLVLFSSIFHNTAIIMLPLYFFVTQTAWSKRIKIVSFCLIGIVVFFPGVANSLVGIMDGMEYQKYMIHDPADDGVNILRVLVALAPVLISSVYYKFLYANEKEKQWIDILINFSLLNFLVMSLALRSTVLARFSMYFNLYNILLIPYFLRIFQKDSRIIAACIIGILFLIYMTLLLPTDSNLLPYKTVWGHIFY